MLFWVILSELTHENDVWLSTFYNYLCKFAINCIW